MIPGYLKKIKTLIIKGIHKPKVFLILFSLFLPSLAFAEAPVKTWKDARIPSGLSGCNSFQGFGLGNDRTENPKDVIISEDGHTIFTVNQGMQSNLEISMNKLRVANQLRTNKTTERLFGEGTADCNDIDGFDPSEYAGSTIGSNNYDDINISRDGKTFIILSSTKEIIKFDLSIPYDFKTAKFTSEGDITVGTPHKSLSFSGDGMTMFSLGSTVDTPIVKTYSLGSSFGVTSASETSSINLTSRGYSLRGDEVETFLDIEFNRNGSEMFILSATTSELNHQILQFSLEKNYDLTTATYIGAYTLDFLQDSGPPKPHRTDGKARPKGFSFSGDGMNLYYVQDLGGNGVDRITHIELECPFGIIKCSSDTRASIVSQVELAKQNISLNVDTIFKRFEWIKRNRDNEDLTSHNFNINYHNPLLKSLASKFEPSLKNNLATLVSNTKKKEKKKKSKWSSWSIVDISIGNYEETLIDKPKDILTKGLTIGSDRKIGDDKFFGLALRYGNSESDIRRSVQEVDLESLTLNIYGVVPTSNTQYINAVLGLSALRFDNKYLQAISGERNGKQAFASINYRTKSAYSKFNITPTGKLTYGVTQLSEFTDFISNTIDAETTDVRYKEDTFKSGEFAGGLLFEMEKYVSDQGTFQPMGGIEIIYDLTDDITYKYQNVGSTAVNKEILSGKYSRQNLKTNIGFEAIHTNGFTVSADYQKKIRLNDKSDAPIFTDERFIVKFSKSKEDDTQFALDFDPLSNNSTNLSYAKDIGNFNLKFNSNYSQINRISDYGANIELSGTF